MFWSKKSRVEVDEVLELNPVGCGTVVVTAALGYDGKGWQAISARETSILNGGVINANGGRLRFQ